MKTSVIGDEFRTRYLSNPDDPDAFEGPAMVFEGPEDYHRRTDDPALGITADTLAFLRGAGPIGYDRTSVETGKSVYAPVDLGGRQSIEKYNTHQLDETET